MANRPLRFEDYIGQERAKTQLKIAIGASIRSGRALPHSLLYGNAGLGKTTLAQIIANEMGVGFHEVMASSLNTAQDLENVLAPLSDEMPDILFIDEIHRLPIKIEELLYTVMEDLFVEVDGVRKWVPAFTLIGATTLAGDLSRPLRDRFGVHYQLQNYQVDEMESIIRRLAEREKVEVTKDALHEIARRSKGVARIGINYFYRCRDYAEFIAEGIINGQVASESFGVLGIDEIGLDENDYRVLQYLATQVRPVGIGTLASGCDIDQATITNIIEPYLVQTGMMNRTSRGREITERGLNWIGQGEDTPVIVENSTSNARGIERVGRSVR